MCTPRLSFAIQSNAIVLGSLSSHTSLTRVFWSLGNPSESFGIHRKLIDKLSEFIGKSETGSRNVSILQGAATSVQHPTYIPVCGLYPPGDCFQQPRHTKILRSWSETVGIDRKAVGIDRKWSESIGKLSELIVNDRFPIDSDDGRDALAVSMGYSSLQRKCSPSTLSWTQRREDNMI